jgi:hypothetical protein
LKGYSSEEALSLRVYEGLHMAALSVRRWAIVDYLSKLIGI